MTGTMINMIPKRQPNTSDWSIGDTKCNATKPLIISPSLLIFPNLLCLKFSNHIQWMVPFKIDKMPNNKSILFANLFQFIQNDCFQTFYKIFFLVLLVLLYFYFYICYWKNKLEYRENIYRRVPTTKKKASTRTPLATWSSMVYIMKNQIRIS